MTPLATFCWGFAGSVAVEVVTLLHVYQAEPIRLPPRYRRPGFWITRLALALLGGTLAVGYRIEQAMLAFNIGAATPLILTNLARGLRPLGATLRSSAGSQGTDPVENDAARERPEREALPKQGRRVRKR